jgi:hypothetical protein
VATCLTLRHNQRDHQGNSTEADIQYRERHDPPSSIFDVTPGLLGLVRGRVGARDDLVGGSSPCHKATPAENISAGGVVIGSRAGVGDRAGPNRRE